MRRRDDEIPRLADLVISFTVRVDVSTLLVSIAIAFDRQIGIPPNQERGLTLSRQQVSNLIDISKKIDMMKSNQHASSVTTRDLTNQWKLIDCRPKSAET